MSATAPATPAGTAERSDRAEQFIGGRWVPTTGTGRVDVIDPTTEAVVGSVPAGSAGDVDAAVDAAVQAWPGWAATPIAERAALLGGLVGLVEGHIDELITAVVGELGIPIGTATGAHVGRLAANVANVLDLAGDVPDPRRIGTSLVVAEPAGVVASITPWNFPYAFLTKALPAVLSGSCVVAKPSEVTGLCAYRMTELLAAVGLPPGVFNVVMGTGATTGAALAGHRGVDVVAFTGSRRAGAVVLRAVADTMARPLLELGGKSAALVLPGAPFEQAVRGTVASCLFNNGQVCGAQTRLVVPAARLAEATEIAVDEMARWPAGPPADPATRVGPVANAGQHARVRAHIRSAIDQGATLACGGPDLPAGLERGWFVQPTVFTDVERSMTIATEEIFGPVLSILAARDTDDAVTIANHPDYGLSGAVWAATDDEAVAVARRLRTGQVQINQGLFNLFAPFGGVRGSGFGRENGPVGFAELHELKSLQLPMDSTLLPPLP